MAGMEATLLLTVARQTASAALLAAGGQQTLCCEGDAGWCWVMLSNAPGRRFLHHHQPCAPCSAVRPEWPALVLRWIYEAKARHRSESRLMLGRAGALTEVARLACDGRSHWVLGAGRWETEKCARREAEGDVRRAKRKAQIPRGSAC